MAFPSAEFPHNVVLQLSNEVQAERGEAVRAFNADMECWFCSMYNDAIAESAASEEDAREGITVFIRQVKETALEAFLVAESLARREKEGRGDSQVEDYAEEAAAMRANGAGMSAACKHGVQHAQDQDENTIKFDNYHTIAFKELVRKTKPEE